MTVILILLAAICGTGALLFLHDRASKGGADPESDPAAEDGAKSPEGEGEECCGMHISCERDSLLAAVSAEIEYYDDEELDRFAGREASTYNDAETEEFREILLTMRPDDIAGWARSLQLRQIELPADVREELLFIVGEARAARTTNKSKDLGTT